MSEVARLRLGLSKPQRKIGGVELAPEQYARYVYLAGAPAKAYLDAYVISPGWQELSDPLKARVIRKTPELFWRGGKTPMIVAPPELGEAKIGNRLQHRTEGRYA